MPVEVLDGRFELGGPLGHGSVGSVREALDRDTGQWVAAKLNNGEAPHRFQREVEILKHLTRPNAIGLAHPNVMELLYVGEERGDAIFYVMPRMAATLADRKRDREGEPFSVTETLEWVQGILRGLAYSLRQGVTHRDVKPANAFEAVDGRRVLGDYSSALADWLPRLTPSAHHVVGTPPYAAPELASGNSEAGPRTEVYAVGCVMYEMLSGSLPITALDAEVAIEDLPALHRMNRELPGWLSEIVSRATTYDPAMRPSSPADLLDELEEASEATRALEPAGVTPRRPRVFAEGSGTTVTAPARRRHPARSHRAGRAVASAALPVMLALASAGSTARAAARGGLQLAGSAAALARPDRRVLATLALGMFASLMLAGTISERLAETTGGGTSNPFSIFTGPFGGLFAGAGHQPAGPALASKGASIAARPRKGRNKPGKPNATSGQLLASTGSGQKPVTDYYACTGCSGTQTPYSGEEPRGQSYGYGSGTKSEQEHSEETSTNSSEMSSTSTTPTSTTPASTTPASTTPASTTPASTSSPTIENDTTGNVSVTDVNGEVHISAPAGAEITQCPGGVTVKTANANVSTCQ
jgi:eukaryotic-like serine/threonine-protein kinase